MSAKHHKHLFHAALSALILIALLFWSAPEGTFGWTNPGQNPPNSAGLFSTNYSPTSGSLHFGLGVSGNELVDKLTIGDGSFYQGAPINPVVVGGHELFDGIPSGNLAVTDVFISGRYAYLVFNRDNDPGNTFRIVDVSNPAKPEVVGSVSADMPGEPGRKIFVSGGYAYMIFNDREANIIGNSGFRIIDISDPSAPTVVGGNSIKEGNAGDQFPSQIAPTDIFVSGKYAYIVFDGTGTNMLRIVDIGNPSSPFVVGGRNISGDMPIDGCHAKGIYTSGKFAYVVYGKNQISEACNITVSGNEVFRILDISNPLNVTILGGGGIGSGEGFPDQYNIAADVVVAGRFAYLGFQGMGSSYPPELDPSQQYFRIIDISDPTNPQAVGGGNMTNASDEDIYVSVSEIFISGSYAYLGLEFYERAFADREAYRQFRIVDISNPLSPLIVGGQNLSDNMPLTINDNSAKSIFVSGRYAYLTFPNEDGSGYENLVFRIIDITGLESTSVLAHSLETGTLQVLTNALFDNNLDVRGSLTVGGGAFFNGNVGINGNLDVTGPVFDVNGNKTFLIDHPLDPENKYLRHSAVEAPEMENLYDGIAVLDAKGEAVVTMPPWFEALNRNFRYLLTPIGEPAPNLYVKEEIKNNRFIIAGGPPLGKVSWQVTGIRQDPWALANPLIVEGNKPEPSYLYPELYR